MEQNYNNQKKEIYSELHFKNINPKEFDKIIQQKLVEYINDITGANDQYNQKKIQDLWSGYGEVVKIPLNYKQKTQNQKKSIICKQVSPPLSNKKDDIDHERKLQSYNNEQNFYRYYLSQLQVQNTNFRIAETLGLVKITHEQNKQNQVQQTQQWWFLLEDLDTMGYQKRLQILSPNDIGINTVLYWLANFHCEFLNKKPNNLWQKGSYWHLETRKTEFQKIKNQEKYKQIAEHIDTKLNNAKFQTFIHGDAKIANFCFSEDHSQVAGVDFQYTGGGVGVKDVAYFLGSCLEEEDCEQYHLQFLENYFQYLKEAVELKNQNGQQTMKINFQELKKEWELLYNYCYADFYRFLLGWKPNFWKVNKFHQKFIDQIIESQKNK